MFSYLSASSLPKAMYDFNLYLELSIQLVKFKTKPKLSIKQDLPSGILNELYVVNHLPESVKITI